MRQAIILVGGRGTRLGDAARNTPKPLMPIAGDVRFLDYLIENIARHDVREIILLAGHLGEQVEARYAQARVRGAEIVVIREPAPAGTAGALRYVADRLDETFLMSNGDSFFDTNYLALEAAMRGGDIGAIALRRVEDAGRYGRVTLDGGRITEFHEKDPHWRGAALISGGVYVLRRDVLGIVGTPPCSIETDVFPKLAAQGSLAGASSEGFFIDIGLPETLAEGRDLIPARLRRGAAFFDRDGTLNYDAGYTHKVEDLKFLPGAVDAIRRCNDAGLLAIVVTNQAGIARGLYGEEHVHAFHAHMQMQLKSHGAHIDAFYHSPFHANAVVPELKRADHPARKPAPGMLRRAMLEWPIDAAQSFIVGDHAQDVAAAEALGLRGFKVEPGELTAAIEAGLAYARAARETGEPTMDAIASLKRCAVEAKRWLFDDALPLWWEHGFDPATRCFHERLDLDGRPVMLPRRIRVQARQTFVYAAAGRLGWDGPWREASTAGAEALLQRGLRSDGGTTHLLDERGALKDDRRDLYDVAFVIFALAQAGAALQRPDLISAGAKLSTWTFDNWTHPKGGLLEGDIVATPPRRQNPHMHMLEAQLALFEASGEAIHLARARGIVDLLRAHFVDTRWGALLEYFNDDWAPCAGDEGRIAEPGHQFEWAWLLDRYRRHTGDAVADVADRIYTHGETYGIDVAGFAIDETWADGAVRTTTSRLWPHTERIKANIIRVENGRNALAAANVVQAFNALQTYFETPTPGVWRDRRLANGAFVEEPAPASSFYHIMMAYIELIRVAETL